jgi:ElaB/YqjD/DUF883 family membrane-anchored ribosome-binding protein
MIRENIAETRERLSSTIEEIGERLNPQTLTENVKDTIRDATIGRVRTMARSAADTVSRTSSGVAHTIRETPIPAALVAMGIGWMLWNARTSNGDRTGRSSRRGAFDADVDRDIGRDIGYGEEYGAAYAGGYGQEYGQQPGAARRVKDAASRAAGTVKDKAVDLGHQASDRARAVADQVSDTTRRQARRVEDAFDENPLMVGAVALAAGLAAGLAVPVSDREVSLLERPLNAAMEQPPQG